MAMGVREVEVTGRKLVIHEGDEAIDSTTGRALTGAWLWDSALHLTEWMTTEGPTHLNLAGKTVLELGAGTGLPGLVAAAVLGAARVVLTDVAPLLPVLRRNAAANRVEGKVEVRELRWGDEVGEVVDVVLMSDVFFDAGEVGGLARTLRGACGEGTRVWAASEVRASVAECLGVLEREGFRVEVVPARSRALLRSPEERSLFAVYVITPPGSL